MTKRPVKTAKRGAKQPASFEKPPLEGFSQEEVARKVGCAQSTVSRAIARGDIEPLSNGRLPESAIETLRSHRQADEKMWSETAALERRLLEAQAGEREAKAALRQLELERESGRFVELAAVQRDGEDTAERIVTLARSIPQRMAMVLECPCQRAAVVKDKLAAEVERLIAALQESMFIKPRSEP